MDELNDSTGQAPLSKLLNIKNHNLQADNMRLNINAAKPFGNNVLFSEGKAHSLI